MSFTLIAHRSGPGLYPEQSIASAKQALKDGADMVEMDVRVTSDGHLVICHDSDTLRIFGQGGPVREMPLQQFLALRYAQDSSYAPHRLEDVLRCGVKPILLHLKVGGELALVQLCALLRQYDAVDTTVFGAERLDDVRILKGELPDCRILAFMPGVDDIEAFINTPVDYIRLWESWLTQERVDRIHASGKQVWLMSCEKPGRDVGYTSSEQLLRFRDMGLDGVLVNEIPWAKSVLDAR